MRQVFKVLCEVNQRNKMLVKEEFASRIALGEDPEHLCDEAIDQRNLKEDIVVAQFKLVCSRSLEVKNTISFVNLPSSRSADVNYSTL